MNDFTQEVQEKCLAFGDRVIKLNDYLLEQESKKEDERCKKQKSGRIPITLKSVANLSNQLLRAGTSIGANNAEPTTSRAESQRCARREESRTCSSYPEPKQPQ